MKKKLTTIIIFLLISGLVLLKLILNKKEIDESARIVQVENVRIPVTVTTVSEEVQAYELIRTGRLAPFKKAQVLSASSGNVQRLLFNPGDNVRQGQALAIIDTRLLELDLQKSESNVSKLGRDLQTYMELLVGNAATQEAVNDLRARYNDAKNQALQLRKQIADATIKAPITGIIGLKAVEEGMFVSAGTEIATIVNLSQLKVQVYFTESEVYQISLGRKTKLTTDINPGKHFFGAVSFISPQANQAYNYQVEITAENDKEQPLRSGTFAYADFSEKTPQKILLIPREALNQSTRNASVYVVQDGKAVLRQIMVGTVYGNKVQVTDGLHRGDQVITSGQINLNDGTLISISK